MKDLKSILSKRFWIWVVVLIISCILIILIGTQTAVTKTTCQYLAAMTIITFIMLPWNEWIGCFTTFFINYISYRSTPFKDTINPLATFAEITKSKDVKDNNGFYHLLYGNIFWWNVGISLLALTFKNVCFSFVYNFLYTMELTLTMQISAFRFALQVFSSIGFVYWQSYFLWLLAKDKLLKRNGSFNFSNWRFWFEIATIVLKPILTGILLKFKLSMILQHLAVCMLLLCIFLIEVYLALRWWKNHKKKGHNTSGPPPTPINPTP